MRTAPAPARSPQAPPAWLPARQQEGRQAARRAAAPALFLGAPLAAAAPPRGGGTAGLGAWEGSAPGVARQAALPLTPTPPPAPPEAGFGPPFRRQLGVRSRTTSAPRYEA